MSSNQTSTLVNFSEFEEKIYSTEDLDNLKSVLFNYFRNKKEIFVAYLYGSIQKDHAGHDLDIGIFSKYDLDELRIETEIEYYLFSKAIKVPVDLKILNDAPIWVKYNIIKDGIRIYSSGDYNVFEFEAHTVMEYLDFKYCLDEYDKMFLKRKKFEIGIK